MWVQWSHLKGKKGNGKLTKVEINGGNYETKNGKNNKMKIAKNTQECGIEIEFLACC